MKRSKKRRNLTKAALLLLGVAFFAAGCGQASYEKAPVSDHIAVVDKAALYTEPVEEPVLYLTVGKNEGGRKSEHIWDEINGYSLDWYEENEIKPYECDALVQFGNEEGPTKDGYGFTDLSSNAKVRLTGKKASLRQQKSYKITIYSDAGSIDGMKSVLLQKCFTDPFRFTNKLCFDLMQESDALMSVRTQFVHLYVKDETEGRNTLFEDYGLYTMTETINKRYLKNRDLDSSGELYKAVDLDFTRHEDVLVSATEAAYNEEKFEQILEPKGSNDYSKLLRLLDAANDEELSIEELIDTYFDKENLYTWMAFNILMGNTETATENFYLYSPTGTEKFYIIPWDNDGALRQDYEKLRDPDYSEGWKKGIHIYSQSALFSRIMESSVCVEELTGYVEKLHGGILSGDNVLAKAKALGAQVTPTLYKMPDMVFARVTEENYNKLMDAIPSRIDSLYQAYYDSIKTPGPFHIHTPALKEGKIVFSWDPAAAPGGKVKYSLFIADSWDFENKVTEQRNITECEYEVGHLPPGQYFAQVSAQTEDGHSQSAYENYRTEKDTVAEGVLCFYVLEDGTVTEALSHQTDE